MARGGRVPRGQQTMEISLMPRGTSSLLTSFRLWSQPRFFQICYSASSLYRSMHLIAHTRWSRPLSKPVLGDGKPQQEEIHSNRAFSNCGTQVVQRLRWPSAQRALRWVRTLHLV